MNGSKGFGVLFFVGLLLAVAGVAVLVVGIVGYQNAQRSLGSALGKLFTGSSSQHTQAIIEMVVGAAAAVLGAVLIVRGRRA